MAKDFYAVLAVPRNATEDQIRQRFRELARARHPDRFRGAEKEKAEKDFQEITQAFNVLVDADQRRWHDLDADLARARHVAADQALQDDEAPLHRRRRLVVSMRGEKARLLQEPGVEQSRDRGAPVRHHLVDQRIRLGQHRRTSLVEVWKELRALGLGVQPVDAEPLPDEAA